jgi:hypothetical protein
LDELNTILLLHAAVTIAMCGVVWFVQVVHYPLFGRVGKSDFAEYENAHSRLTSFVVAPLMLTEAATAIGVTMWLPQRPLVWWGLGLLVCIWISTFLLQVPQHRRLRKGFDATAHRRLLQTNWLRTI